MPKVTLHTCSYTFLKTKGHSCWRVRQALDEQGIEYTIVKHGFVPGKRPEIVALSDQKQLPVIEFEDGSAYRAESVDMAARVRAGELFS
jgi:glutathione S-transferase